MMHRINVMTCYRFHNVESGEYTGEGIESNIEPFQKDLGLLVARSYLFLRQNKFNMTQSQAKYSPIA